MLRNYKKIFGFLILLVSMYTLGMYAANFENLQMRYHDGLENITVIGDLFYGLLLFIAGLFLIF